MPFSFPASPTVGQKSTQNGREYVWSGSAWNLSPAAGTIEAGSVTGLATVATSGLASDLTGTLADSRLSTNARQSVEQFIHPFLLAGM